MRLTTEFWVSALLRRAFAEGFFGAIEKRGAGEAGAVFVLRRDRDGTTALYSPAPQSDYSGDMSARRFVCEMENVGPEAVRKRLDSEARFDSDMWIVEIEADAGRLEEWIGPTTPA